MNPSNRSFSPAQASIALGVSVKALRLYERLGLISPDRTRTGWRTYDAAAMTRAAEIVTLRGLGLSLGQIAGVLLGDGEGLGAALCAHEERLNERAEETAALLWRVRKLRADLAQDRAPGPTLLSQDLALTAPHAVEFALPWPWNGEWFALADIPRLTFITGPLGSGKTRFARRLASELPGAAFVGLDRLSDTTIAQRLAEDAHLAKRVERRLAWLIDDGAEHSQALTVLAAALEAEAPAALVIDMVEESLSAGAQAGLMAHLRLRGTGKRAVFLMTRSSSILDLNALEPDEAVILCPANHSPPFRIMPHPGGRGYEGVATCLARPEVRARTAGVTAMRPAAP